MIITRTPLRISLVGGGTDMPEFYERHGGAVVSMAINKYIYITYNKKFDSRIRLSYSKTENVEKALELQHDIARACLEGISGIEVASISDIPGEGSGLGSSSSFTVGLINAMRDIPSPEMLAELAYKIEAGCGHNCGKQDHYAAAFGGLKYYTFNKDGSVHVESLLESYEKSILEKHLLLFWTGKTRKAGNILSKQAFNIKQNDSSENAAIELKGMAFSLANRFNGGYIHDVGEYLAKNWELKKKLSHGITDPWIDSIYERAILEGAEGGKICGAGGGGFMLFYAEPRYHAGIEKAVGLRRVSFAIEDEGSKVIYGR
jgi:D-glycero-alpha-D-manno-heptose-7-phosphate kinase